ncbi:alpha/beta fold hydrolase [Pseudarcicella hirudinis]|nr:alpha/beta hydrolase [Pseudarcicella hirudinis]
MILSQKLQFEVAKDFYLTADVFGNADNPPVVLLHGGGQTRHSWGDTAAKFAGQGYYAIAFDARGHGDSSWSEEGAYRIEDLVKDLKSLIANLKGKPALVGASLGGMTSLVAEGEAEESICSALVLVDIAPKTEQKGIERIFAFMSSNTHGFASLDEAAEAVAAYLPHRTKPEDHSRLEKNLRLREDGRYYWHWDVQMLKLWKSLGPDQMTRNEERMYEAAKKLNVPTMIVRGGMSDVVSEKIMAEFLDAVPHVRSVNVSGAGHMVAGDSNHAFTNAVLDFLREVYPSGNLS